MHSDAALVKVLVNQVKYVLAGHPPEIQGAALADLLAIWLAGHRFPHSPAAETDALREELLKAHIEATRQLIPLNAEAIHGKAAAERR